MILLIPYRVDVPMARWPVANVAILATMVLAFGAQLGMSATRLEELVLGGTSAVGWVTYMWLHGGVFHLLGNMLFLWVFGNAVCAKLGNLVYAPVYVGLGLVAAAAHMAFDGSPAVGASGAINGVVGLYLVLYPRNDISCFYLLLFRPGTFTASSFWLILMWLAFDVLGVALGAPGVAYWAHLGGFAVGFGLGLILLRTGTVRMEPYEQSLPAAWKAWRDRKKPRRTVAARVPRSMASRSRPQDAGTIPFEPEPSSMVKLRCPCGTHLKAPARLAGRTARCPTCSRSLRVPSGAGGSGG